MSTGAHPRPCPRPHRILAKRRLVELALVGLAACNGDRGADGRPGDPGSQLNELPGVVVEVQAVSGGTGPGGAFRSGDFITVDYSVKQDDGTSISLTKLARTAVMVSGPTFSYQRVIASQSDLATKSTVNDDGSYRYRFSVPIPETYLAPLNDTANFTAGELTGQALLSGTYTIGIEARRDITIGEEVFRDVGNATFDFLFGSASVVEPRAVVSNANCNQCHVKVQAHGGNRNRVENCLLCHTAGAEDRNVAEVENGTPDVTIDFSVMIHKIHAGANLPSVVGLTTKADGTRDYSVASKPYKIVGFNNSVTDFSHVQFPVWPSFFTAMPRDTGFGALPGPAQAKENLVRRGPVACAKCHGDPDGDGPLTAPAQGDLVYSQPSRRACGSCHDDWVPSQPYIANMQPMPAQIDDSECIRCHTPSGITLSVRDAHLHPLVDPTRAPGVKFVVTSVTDVGGNGDGKLSPGEKVGFTFRVETDAGTPIAADTLSRIEVTLAGPAASPQMLDYQRLPPAYFSGNGPYTVNLPDQVFYQPIGTSNNTLQAFVTPSSPHWNIDGAASSLLLRTGTGASTTLAADARVTQNYVDVATGTGSNFFDGDYIVIDDLSGSREYMRVQWVDGDRLWFGSRFRTSYKPNLLVAHTAGMTVQAVSLTTVPTASWTLDASTGVFAELVEFGNGEVLASYTTDFVVPAVYPGALDDSPVIGEDWGDWTGLPLRDGTYTFEMHGARTFTYSVLGENTGYTEAASPAVVRVLFGAATTVTTVARVVGASACANCHNDITQHGGSRRGFDGCIQCHGAAGSEKTLLYEDPFEGNPLGTSAEFRSILHALHKDAFPALPGGVSQCAACHGADNTAWKEPPARSHPNQTVPARVWSVACSSCHDSRAARAHVLSNQTSTGDEACATCHGPDADYSVERVHKAR